MSVPEKSRYQSAVAAAALPGEAVPGAVRFTAGAFSLGWLRSKGERPVRIIRLALHAGQAIEVALTGPLAVTLGAALHEGGDRPPAQPRPEPKIDKGGMRRDAATVALRGEEAWELYLSGKSLAQIGRAMGFSDGQAVGRLLRRERGQEYAAIAATRNAWKRQEVPA